jgi:hypothetical protein
MATMSRHYTRWTLPELRRISQRRMDGEEWDAIAQDYDVGPNAIRGALARNGLYYGERQTMLTWDQVVARVGWGKTPAALRAACRVHAARDGVDVWRGRGAA